EISALKIAGAAMIRELGGKIAMGTVGLGGDEKARSVLVEPVDDARPLDPANARQRALAMMEEGVDQCARPVAGTGMDDEPGRLVDDDQFGILKDDLERNVLRLGLGGHRRRDFHLDRLIPRDLETGVVGHHSAKAYLARFHQRLYPGARQARQERGQSAVQPLAAELGRNGDAENFRDRIVHMARKAVEIDEEELSPAQEKVVRRMRMLVGISTGIMALGFLLVMSVIVWRVVKQEAP